MYGHFTRQIVHPLEEMRNDLEAARVDIAIADIAEELSKEFCKNWDKRISANNLAVKAKKYRGEFIGILPSRTRK